MRSIISLLILCLSWLPAVDAGPGTLTYYPETFAVTGIISATAAGSRGLVVAGSGLSLLGQPAGSIALYKDGVASTLYTSGSCTAVDADKNGVIVAIVVGSDGQQTLLRSTTATPAFQEIAIPSFSTNPLKTTQIRLTPDGGFVVVGNFQVQFGVSRPAVVAQWSPTTGWSCLEGLTGTVIDLISDGQGRILAGGRLSVAGASVDLVRYDAGAWTPVTIPGWPTWPIYTDPTMQFANFANGDVVIATSYDQELVWLPSAGTWSSIASPSDRNLRALGVDGDDAPMVIANSGDIQRWANGSWTTLAGITWDWSHPYYSLYPARIHAITNGLVIAGAWTTGSGNDVLYQWDGTTWSGIGGDKVHPVYTRIGWLADAGDLVVADINRLIRYDGSKWNVIPNSVWPHNPIGAPYLTSTFKTANGYGVTQEPDISFWNGSSWSTTVLGGKKIIMPLVNGDVIVAGQFTLTAIDGTANNIARWDGSHWHRLGGGTGGKVTAMLRQADGSVVVGGIFTAVDGDLPAPSLALWNGSTWSRLNVAEIPGGQITALGNDVNGDLVIGLGRPLYYDGTSGYPPVNVADAPLVYRWHDSAWSPLGVFSGYSPAVTGFVQDGRGGLIAQGTFNIADSVPVNGLARWDGNSWNSMGATVAISYSPIGGQPVLGSPDGVIGTSWGKIARWTAPKIMMSSLRSDTVAGRNFGSTTDHQPTLFGTGIPGQGYSLRQGATTVYTGTVDAYGRWSATLPGTWPDGSNALTFVPADASVPSQTATFAIGVDGGGGGSSGGTDESSSGGGCGNGGGIAMLLGAFLLAYRKRAA